MGIVAHAARLALPLAEQPGSPSKHDKSRRSLSRYNAISAAAQLILSGFVHHQSHPISQQTKAGFNRRGEVGMVDDDAKPIGDVWTGGEQGKVVTTCRPSRPFTGAFPSFAPSRQSLAVGVAQFTTEPTKVGFPPL